jgi:hypothetical protein
MKEMTMYLDPYSNLISITQQRRLKELSVQRHRPAPDNGRHAARQAVAAVRQAVGAILRWVADLPYDSRERFHSKEQEFARLGVSWVTDPAYDAALACEIEVARQRHLAVVEFAQRADVPATPGPVSPSRSGRRRIAVAGS